MEGRIQGGGMKRSIILVLVWAMLAAFPALSARNSFPEQGTAEDFFKWQKDTREWLRRILFNGPGPEAVPLGPVYGRKEKRESYELTEVAFHDRPGHQTHGWLARPLAPQADRLPAVISLHGHGFDAHATFDPKNMYCYGHRFAQKGYVVFAPDIGHDFIEHDKPLEGYGPLPRDVPFPYMGQKVWMVIRTIDFLQGLSEVDGEKIGVVGLSNGGMTAMFAAAVDTRLKLAVASGSLIMHERMWHRELLHCRCQYLNQMDGALDYYDVFALIAPRPLVIQSGQRDPIFPIHSADQAFQYVKKAYTLAGTGDLVYHDVHHGKHEYRPEVPEPWFARHLPIKK